jgi:hypothetical protein
VPSKGPRGASKSPLAPPWLREWRGGAARHAVVTGIDALLSWLAAIPRCLGSRLFAANDLEADWRGWQITAVHGGLARRYRDPLFDTLAACARCRGAGVRAAASCFACRGTGRVAVGEVS